MKEQIPDFWGSFLSNGSNGGKPADLWTEWMIQGLKGLEEWAEAYRKISGLETTGKDDPDLFWLWRKTQEELRASFKDFLVMLGALSRNEYLMLLGKFEEIKQKAMVQEETIKRLRKSLAEARDPAARDRVQQLDEMLKKQGEQILKLIERSSQLTEKNGEPKEPAPPARP